MNPCLYRAAMEGKIDVQNYKNQFETQRTPNKNTVLHVSALFGKSVCAAEILRNQPSLLLSLNDRGETAFHLAAREGHTETVKGLIMVAKSQQIRDDMLRLTNCDGDTPLHEAVRFGEIEVVKVLVMEDPEFCHPWNKAEESPLYLAAEKGFKDVVFEILKYCKSPSYVGPMRRTALHAAVIIDCEGCTTEFLKWKPNLLRETDIEGWAPIHFAARLGRMERITQMLEKDSSLAYLTLGNACKRTAIHIAASEGHVSIVDYLISYVPDCWESVDSKGLNILHIAISEEHSALIRYILKNPMLQSLVNQKTLKGNTPLHLNTMHTFWDILLLAEHPRVDKMAFNKDNLTPFDLANRAPAYQEKHVRQLKGQGARYGLRNEISLKCNSKKAMYCPVKLRSNTTSKVIDTHMIVAALVVTITFTAGFAVPGGYNGNEGPKQGMAMLAKKAAFQAFIIWDSLALILSTLALVIYFTASLHENLAFYRFMEGATTLITIAIGAMMAAFVAGTYVILQQQSLGIAITTCTISCCFFPVYFSVVRKLYGEVSATFLYLKSQCVRFLNFLVWCLSKSRFIGCFKAGR